jgi:hypothetical protein
MFSFLSPRLEPNAMYAVVMLLLEDFCYPVDCLFDAVF